MVKPGTFIFWDASRLFWFSGLLDNISIRFMRSFSSQTKYTGEFWKAYTKMVYRILNLFIFIFKMHNLKDNQNFKKKIIKMNFEFFSEYY